MEVCFQEVIQSVPQLGVLQAEDLLLFMNDIAQVLRDIRNGKKLEQTYPPGINNKWTNAKIYN